MRSADRLTGGSAHRTGDVSSPDEDSEAPSSPSVEVPRRFALRDVELEEDGCPEDVGWGLDFGDRAVVYLRHPDGDRSLHGVFGSADHACGVLGSISPLRVVWT